LSSIRDRVEYNLIHTIFHSTYILPEDFSFAEYLSHSYARFSLKLTNRSLFTWFMFLLSILANFLRIRAGYACHMISSPTATHRRMMDSYSSSGSTTVATDDHQLLLEEEILAKNEFCHRQTLRLFLAAGCSLTFFTLLVVYVSRVYKIRLVSFFWSMLLYLALIRCFGG
jgi:hypothetical protein